MIRWERSTVSCTSPRKTHDFMGKARCFICGYIRQVARGHRRREDK